MKLITFTREGMKQRVGAIVNNQVVDLHTAYKSLLASEGKIRAQQIAEAFVPADMTGFLQGGKESVE
ncbi:FAA hydrolase family protein, partial [Priestia filamentosa]